MIDELKAIDPARDLDLPTAGLDELRDGVLAQSRTSARHAGRWAAGLAAAAAVVVAVVLFWQGSVGSRVVAVPAGTPSAVPSSPAGAWVRTATPPLSVRHSSVVAWIDGTFVVIGGDATPACAPNADCVRGPRPLTDGARYDPATDTWTRIAEAPVPLANDDGIADAHPLTATLDHRVYVVRQPGYSVPEGPTQMLAYDVETDRWETLDSPSSDQTLALLAGNGFLLAVTGVDGYESFDPAAGSWVSHQVDGLPGPILGAALIGDRLVASGIDGHDLAKLWVATVDLATDRATILEHPAMAAQRPMPVSVRTATGGFAVWARAGDLAWFLDPATGAWTSAARPDDDGTFTGSLRATEASWFVTAAGMIAIRGHLYDPVARLWSPTPVLPVGTLDPVLASGTDSVLACFGYEQSGAELRSVQSCSVLRPAPATAAVP